MHRAAILYLGHARVQRNRAHYYVPLFRKWPRLISIDFPAQEMPFSDTKDRSKRADITRADIQLAFPLAAQKVAPLEIKISNEMK